MEPPDSVTLTGRFAGGPLLTALFTGAVQGGTSYMTIHGSAGTLTCYPEADYIDLHAEGKERRIDVPADERKQWTVERDFIAAVREGRKGSPSFADGVRYMAFTQAVADSIRSGSPVEVSNIQE